LSPQSPKFLHAGDPLAASRLSAPAVVLFDWHATLVDTQDAMYRAVDAVLADLDALGLAGRLRPAAEAVMTGDGRLLDYVQRLRRLPPEVKAARRVSRTDLFEILFGDDEEAKLAAHAAFNAHYREFFGAAQPFAGGEHDLLVALAEAGIPTGLLSNREREFVTQELALVDGGRWQELFGVVVCGADAGRRKPAPDPVLKALAGLGCTEGPGPMHWYVGDSTTDVTAAKRAGVTAVFFNGAGWSGTWFEERFPGTPERPYVPDVVVDDCRQLRTLIAACLAHAASQPG